MLRRCCQVTHSSVANSNTVYNVFASSQKRFLKIAKSVFGYYLGRRGQRKYPFHRRPHIKNTHAMNVSAPYFWSFMTAKSQSNFLPEENYITGDWTGKFFVSKRQVYTLQHATSGAKVRVKSFPSVFEFNSPSRWNIGKELNTLTKPRMDLIDEQMLTKKQRLDYVKAGLLPKEIFMNYLSHSGQRRESADTRHDLLVEKGISRVLTREPKNIRQYVDVKANLSTQWNHDIEKINEEKRNMRDWLERGVAEAERVSAQLVHLAEEVRCTDERVKELDYELHDLDERYSDTRRLIQEAASELQDVQYQVVERGAIETAQTDPEKVQNVAFLKEMNVLQKDFEEMRVAVPMTETAESALQCLADCSRQTLHQLEKMSFAVNDAGVLGVGGKSMNINDESFGLDGSADNALLPPLTLETSKAILDRCDACLCTVWSAISRIARDRAHQRRQKDTEFQDAYMTVGRDLEDTIGDSSAHLQQIREELALWRHKCDTIKTMLPSNTTDKNEEDAMCAKNVLDSACDAGYGEALESFAALTRKKNTLLIEENTNLQTTNDLLRQKLETAESDYRALKELKHAYRDLELRKSELKQINEQLRKTNRAMKLRTWENTPLIGLGVPGK